MDLQSKIFTGASIVLHDKERSEETIQKLAALPAVKRFWRLRSYQQPEYTVEWSGNVPDGRARELMRRQNAAANDTFSPHVMTQVNQLRDEGIRGKGIKIAVVDSGVSTSSFPPQRAPVLGAFDLTLGPPPCSRLTGSTRPWVAASDRAAWSRLDTTWSATTTMAIARAPPCPTPTPWTAAVTEHVSTAPP